MEKESEQWQRRLLNRNFQYDACKYFKLTTAHLLRVRYIRNVVACPDLYLNAVRKQNWTCIRGQNVFKTIKPTDQQIRLKAQDFVSINQGFALIQRREQRRGQADKRTVQETGEDSRSPDRTFQSANQAWPSTASVACPRYAVVYVNMLIDM